MAPRDHITPRRATMHCFSPYLPLRPRTAWSRADAGWAATLFVSSLALYTSRMAPALSSVSLDSNELITKSALLAVAHNPGSPFYVWIAHAFTWLPFGEIATRVNWMSAFFGAVTVALLYLGIVRHGTGERLGALGGAVLLGLSLTFW